MGHILADEPELIKYVVGFALFVGSIPFWGDIYTFLRCSKCRAKKVRAD